MGVIVPAGEAGRSTVDGYDPKKHDPFFDGVSQTLADKGFVTAAVLFLVDVTIGYVYAWKLGALEWE